ncbi:unnamed protein product [Rotaria sordida]|uniref:LRAT domain-containing protein n=1 Tax=Rotaria sordida TaxID=392033 RepID=A0A814TS07_9BILA|nr:unnamed protein product [Rotaria sordida]CAF3796051.1 unnamed protein product [Rotaria sordida]
MSTYAATTITTTTTTTATSIVTSTNQTITKRPLLTPSTTRILLKEDEQQCLPINTLQIDRICSKTCRTRKTPFEKFDNIKQYLTDTHYLPFCFNILNQTIVKENFFNETTENECRQILNQILIDDKEAQKATELFATYMQAIDSASEENRYSIIYADCQKAYRTWACSIKIPYYYQNQRIPPCQTICDEVERVCPTFRPSDREPLFAGQPLFVCNGGIVPKSDYRQPPHCFDICHLFHGSQKRPFSFSSSISNETSSSSSFFLPSISKFIEDIVTTPPCFEIKPLPPPSSEQIISPLIFVNESIFDNTKMASIVKIEKSKENEDVLENAQLGDMIEFIRGAYSHWAIYVGNGCVIHRWGDHDGIGKSVGFWGNLLTFSGTQFDKATILQSHVSDVLKLGGKVRINNYLDNKYKPLPVEVILDKARRALNQEGYNLVYSNCEHFVTECRYGQPNSRQVQIAVGASAVTGVVATALAAAGAAFLLRDSSEQENKEKDVKKVQINT